MAYVQANGIRMYWERAGQGDPLLFISGSGGESRHCALPNKPNQFDSRLGGAFDLICYDQRGLGQTENPPGQFTMAQYADDAAALLDALGIPRIAMIGVSFGGMVGQELLLRHPQKVSAAVLACTSSGGEGGASYPLHELSHLPRRARAEAHLKVSDTRHTDERIAQDPERWERLVAMTLEREQSDRDLDGAAKQLEARRHHDTFGRLKDIQVPVLLTGGRFDGIAPPSNMQALNDQIPQSELRFYEGGHLFLIQDKRAYQDIITWLRDHAG